ncbi:MAG TPA: hypothetical protein VGM07_10835 [Stellaceae bacterium]|jgi:hypothetical protein
MTLIDVEELTRYWVDHPPLHLMVAAYLGVGKGNGKRTRSGSVAAAAAAHGANRDVGALLAELGPSFAGADVHAGLAPVVLDFAELRRGAKPAG